MIWFGYCGYCEAVSTALANDFVSSAWTLVGDLAASGDAAIAVADRGRVAGGEQRAEDRLHDRAAEVALEVGGAGGHAGALDRAPSR